jgi:hypothetical protein
MLRFAHSQGYPDIPDFLLDWVATPKEDSK